MTLPTQSTAARTAMLLKWARDDATWHTPDLVREMADLLELLVPADAIAAGHLENAARMKHPTMAGLLAAAEGDAVLTESPHDEYPIQVIRTGGRRGGKVTELEARIASALATGGSGCVVVYGLKGKAECRRHGGTWPHRDDVA